MSGEAESSFSQTSDRSGLDWMAYWPLEADLNGALIGDIRGRLLLEGEGGQIVNSCLGLRGSPNLSVCSQLRYMMLKS